MFRFNMSQTTDTDQFADDLSHVTENDSHVNSFQSMYHGVSYVDIKGSRANVISASVMTFFIKNNKNVSFQFNNKSNKPSKPKLKSV